MSAKDPTTSHGLWFVDGSDNTNQFRGSGVNIIHIDPTGATGAVWDAINLPNPASTNLVDATSNAVASAFVDANTAASNYTATTYLPISGTNVLAATNQNVSAFPNNAGYVTATVTNGLPITTGTYAGMNVGTATYAAFANNANTATNLSATLTVAKGGSGTTTFSAYGLVAAGTTAAASDAANCQ